MELLFATLLEHLKLFSSPFLEIQDVLGYTEDVAARSKKPWGGRREGAGRKPRLSDGVSFTGEIEIVECEIIDTKK